MDSFANDFDCRMREPGKNGTPVMKARSNHLLAKMEREYQGSSAAEEASLEEGSGVARVH